MLIGGETENLSWTQKPPTRFVIETFQLITFAVCCGYVLNLIGRRTINIPEIILGVHGFMGFTIRQTATKNRAKFYMKYILYLDQITKHAQFCEKTFDLLPFEMLSNIIPYQLPYNSKWNETKAFIIPCH